MKKYLSVLFIMLGWPCASFSQLTSTSSQAVSTGAQLMQWVQTQQANIGLGLDWHGIKYVTTSWDVISLGSSGINVGAAGSKDYFDLGPLTSAANGEKTRYGGLPL